jgi:hypothetical protein
VLEDARGTSDSPLSLDADLFATARQALAQVEEVDESFESELGAPQIELAGGLDALEPRSIDNGDKLTP